MNKKGFTLVELLAVIVILAIIAVISAPIINGIIEDSRMSAFKSSVNGIKKAIETDYGNHGFVGPLKYEYFLVSGEGYIEVYNKDGVLLRNVEYSGKIDGDGAGYIDEYGHISVIFCTDKYYGSIYHNTPPFFRTYGGSYTREVCIDRVNSLGE